MDPERARVRMGAKAVFAGAAFGLAVLGIFALERVGAPDGLVTALGPLIGLFGVACVGIMARAKTLSEFLAARRIVPPLYAGVAIAAPIGGFALAFSGNAADASILPWRGVIAGVVVAVLFAAPAWRSAQASAIGDVLATRFPWVFARIAFALLLGVCGCALAAAGLGYAALSVADAFGVSFRLAMAICAVTLAASLAPGGLSSLVWADAASGGAGLLVMGLFVALSAQGEGSDRLLSSARALSEIPGSPVVEEIAAGAGVASLFAFAGSAFAVPSAGAARLAGLAALVVLIIGAAAAAMAGNLALKSPSESALAALVGCMPALALARGGIYPAARALGLDLARAYKPLSVLGSRRMAIVRYGVLVGVAVASVVALRAPNPSAPLYFALAVWLAFGAPSLLLAALPGRNAAPATAALAAGVLAAVAGRRFGFGDPGYGPGLLVGALGAGLAGLAAGLCVFVLTPIGVSKLVAADPFVEVADDGASEPPSRGVK